jgi:S1-C subfamily serine protease
MTLKTLIRGAGLGVLLWLALPGARAAGIGDYIDNGALQTTFRDRLVEFREHKTGATPKELREQLAAGKHSAIKTETARRVKLDKEELYRSASDSVVAIGKLYKCEKCDQWHVAVAGAFAIAKDGVFVTNYHVMEGDERAEAVGVMTREGRVFAVNEILSANKVDDVAVFKTDLRGLPPLPVTDAVNVGATVYVISHAVDHYFTFTQGIVSGKFLNRYQKGKRAELAITADFCKGSSGGPILDETGTVVGMVRSTTSVYYDQVKGVDENLQMVWKYCVPGDRLLAVLKGTADAQ